MPDVDPIEKIEEVKPKRKDQVLSRLRSKYPDKKYEDDEEVFGDIEDGYSELENKHKSLLDENGKIAKQFVDNPSFAAFFSAMMEGKNPAIAFVENFGKDALDMTDDPETLQQLMDADASYKEKSSAGKKIAEEQKTNLENSQVAFDAFQKERSLSDEEMNGFIDEISNRASNVFMGIYTPESLLEYWDMIHQGENLAAAEAVGEVKGKNAKFTVAKKKTTIPQGIPPMVNSGNGGSEKPINKNLAGLDRIVGRKSIWETGK